MDARLRAAGRLAGIAVLSCCSIWGATPAECLTLDDFEVGAFSLQAVASDGDVTQTQTGLNTSNVLTGERRTTLNSQSTSTPATGTLVLTPADDAVDFFAPAPTSGFLSSNLSFQYLFNNFDLTAGGTIDRITVEVSSASGQGSLSVFGDSGTALQGGTVQSVAAPGTYTFFFSEYTVVDFTQLDELRVNVSTGFGASVSVSRVAAIPEPSTGLLLALGLAAMPIVRTGGRFAPRPTV